MSQPVSRSDVLLVTIVRVFNAYLAVTIDTDQASTVVDKRAQTDLEAVKLAGQLFALFKCALFEDEIHELNKPIITIYPSEHKPPLYYPAAVFSDHISVCPQDEELSCDGTKESAKIVAKRLAERYQTLFISRLGGDLHRMAKQERLEHRE